MIDYFGHMAVLDELARQLGTAGFADATTQKARQRTLDALARDGDLAALGSVLDHLLAHAESDGTELDLLQQAADLWRDGLAIYDDVAAARTALESALTDPAAPTAPARFQQAYDVLGGLEQRATDVITAAMALPAQLSPPRYLRRHPRQADLKTPDWNWGDLFLARRTDAFVRAVADSAGHGGDDDGGNDSGHDGGLRAFAFGVLACYGGNAAGSAYLARTVGGPRRAHPYRDRLARYASGAWLREHRPGLPGLARLAQRLRWGHPSLPAQLPAAVKDLLQRCLESTYDTRVTAPLPNLQAGYARLLRHLNLLAVFELPANPAPLAAALAVRKAANPSAYPAIDLTLKPAGKGGAPPGGGVSGASDSEETKRKTCWAGLAVLILVLVAVFVCIVSLGTACGGGGAPKKDPSFPDPPPPGTSTAALSAFAATNQAVHVADVLWQLQQHLWQAFSNAADYLAVLGLIYPNTLQLTQPVHAPFTAMPAAAPYPHREPARPNAGYEVPPTTVIEHAVGGPAPYPPLATPASYVAALHPALQLWRQMARNEADSPNLDLDADRDAGAPCWDIAAGSIHDDPVPEVVLAYQQTAA